MSDSDFICKHCGSDDIVAEMECHATDYVRGRIRDRGGKPSFDETGSPGGWGEDWEHVQYVCECGEGHWKLEELVVRRRAYNELRLPCGRCDHDAHEHERSDLSSRDEKRGFTRGLMPCTVAGCDCHDYYDQALGLTPNWPPLRQEALAA